MKIHILRKDLIHISYLTFLLVLFLYNSLFSQQPELIWFGTLGGNNSEARAISADGSVVVGVANDANGNPHAFRWTAATGIQDLGTLGGDWSEATDVSADGSVIVGWSYDNNSIYRAFKWTAVTGMIDLGAGDFSKAYGVSADGLIVIIDIYPGAYRWTQAGGLQDLGTLGGSSSSASDISDNGSYITGTSYNNAGDPYAFRWFEGTGIEQIGTYYSFGMGISGDGNTITGFETGSAGVYRAFRWTEISGFEYNVAGDFSQGNAISGDGGIIVGDNGGGAFRLSTAGGLEELNQVYSGLLTPGSDMYTALGISPDGQFIVGKGINGATSQDEGFLLAINGISSVNDMQRIPNEFILKQNYPNPFNPSTTIKYQIPENGFVSLKVYDVLGNEITTLVNEEKLAGSYEVEFNAEGLTSGIYFYKLQFNSFTETKKMILMK